MYSKKPNFLFSSFFLILFFSFFNFIFPNLVLAQDFEEEGSSTFTESSGNETNLFLQNNLPVVAKNQLTSAQKSNGKLSGIYEGSILSCPYAFERDLAVGSKGEDVKLLQVLLNSDKRTLIAVSGIGSPSSETTIFGGGTKDAIKRFQALFIEYIGVANGRFGPKTRTVMNAICNGETKPTTNSVSNSQNKNIFTNVVSVQKDASPTGVVTNVPGDKIAPRISLTANLNTVEKETTFKVVANLSEEVNSFTAESIIIDGGVVKEIRKLSKTSYAVSVIPAPEAKNVMVQVEADKITDLAGNTNENASNEINVKIINSLTTQNTTNASSSPDIGLNSILDKIISSAPNCKYTNNGILITVDPLDPSKTINTTGCAQQQTQNGQTYNCNGQQIPNTQACNNQSQTVCTTTVNPYTGIPQQQCQQVTPQQAAQQQAAQQQAQQAQQNGALGQLLGNLLKGGGGLGGGQSGSNGAGGGGGGGGGNPAPGPGPTKDTNTTLTPQQKLDKCLKDKETSASMGGGAESCSAQKDAINPLGRSGKILKKIECAVAKKDYSANSSGSVGVSVAGREIYLVGDVKTSAPTHYIIYKTKGEPADKNPSTGKCYLSDATDPEKKDYDTCCKDEKCTKDKAVKLSPALPVFLSWKTINFTSTCSSGVKGSGLTNPGLPGQFTMPTAAPNIGSPAAISAPQTCTDTYDILGNWNGCQ